MSRAQSAIWRLLGTCVKFENLKFLNFVFVGMLLASASTAKASKIEIVQNILKQECKIKVNPKKALTLIRPLYLTCVPGTEVSVGQCNVKCLRTDKRLKTEDPKQSAVL